MTPSTGRPVNRLLRALRPEAYERIAPKLRRAVLESKQVLYKPNEQIREVYFPETAVLCLLAVMENGDTIQTATVGVEGASWISATVGASSMPCETITAIAGDALALSVEDLDEEMRENAPFRDVLTHYSHALLIHSFRMTGCAGLHSLSQRCATWMLETLDRVPENRFSVTHEFLAMLLGASRPALSVLIHNFHENGLIVAERGSVRVANREGLKAAACECYEVIKRSYEQVGR